MDETRWAPVAVVALGDPGRRDEGLPIRVLGRVRTLIAEIGCARRGVPAMPAASAAALAQGNLALELPAAHGDLVQWIEGGRETGRLDPFLQDRRRVVLIDMVELGRKPGSVCHWHMAPGRHGLTYVQHYGRPRNMDLQHLAFWLEDDLPASGLDLIAIEPSDTAPGVGLSPALQGRFATISSQVTALLFRILVEEGW